MVVKFLCTTCQKRLAAKEELVGRSIKCPACAASILVPRKKSAAATDGKIHFRCPSCHRSINAGVQLVGKQVACPGCKGSITVPTSPGPEAKKQTEFVAHPGPIRFGFRREQSILVERGVLTMTWSDNHFFEYEMLMDFWRKTPDPDPIHYHLSLNLIRLPAEQQAELAVYLARTFTPEGIVCGVCGGSGDCSCAPASPMDRVRIQMQQVQKAREAREKYGIMHPLAQAVDCELCKDSMKCAECEGKGKY